MRFSLLVGSGALALGLGAAYALAQTPAPVAPPGAAAPAVSPDAVVARADGIVITEGDIATAGEDPTLNIPGMAEAQKRELLINYLVDLRLGARAAEQVGIGKSPEFARRLEYFRSKLLLDEYLDREVKKAVSEDAMRKLYEETVKTMTAEPEVRARHILVATEDEAKKAHARVTTGKEDFAKVAEELSNDPGSKGEGGDLGFFSKERMVEPFAETAFKLEPGQISPPIQTQFGWHVIKVEEKRTRPIPTFEETREQIETFLTRRAQQELILALRKGANVERLDKPPSPAAPAAPKQ
jgi:peptidyl-prolyl cis-trans isomerase C